MVLTVDSQRVCIVGFASNTRCLTTPFDRHSTNPQIAYAESTGECRRAMLMHHFGERTFGPAQCGETCDVCQQLAAGGKQVRE
jgi:hypothetical protein